MAATFAWAEHYGAGKTALTPTTINWFSNATASNEASYQTYPVTAGTNSWERYQYGLFTTGTFNNISAGLWAHTATAFPANAVLAGKVTSTWATPSTTTMSGSTAMTTAISIGSGQTVLFAVANDPAGATAASRDGSATRATQYLVSQLQPASNASPGDTVSGIVVTLQYDEN